MARTFPGEVLTMGPNEEPVANYMTRAAYGNPREKGWYAKSVVTVYAPNGVPFAVHREAAPAFDGFLKELSATGYTIRPADSGGYNLRTKRGGTSLSQHAFGNAIDINWSTNPMQRQLKTDMPENIKDMAAKWGLEWGGTWRGQKDAMHFEWTGVPVMPGMGALRSKEDIMAAQRMLAAQGLYNGEIDGETGPMTRAAIADYAQASGTMVAGDNALPLPDYSGDPFGVAASKQPQDAQGAIASLIAPTGGPAVPDMPTAAMGYAPNLSGTEPPAPPMPQVASNPAPLPTPPPQWVNGDFAQDTMVGGTSPPMPRLRDQSVLEQQRADMLDEMLFGAGPHRGEYARGRPEGRWTGGGAPDASAVPTPSLSPLNPAVGGPADRRPTPPMPTLRPEGRWMSGAGGAPDAGSVPNPPSNPRRDPFGFPIDVNRPRLNNGDGTFSTEQTITFDASEVGLPSEIVTIPTIINGQKVSDQTAMAAFARGLNEPVQRGFDSFEEADKAAIARTDSIARARATTWESRFPEVFGEQPPTLSGGMSAEIGNAPFTPPRATRETWNSMGLGSRGNAETQMSLDRDWSQPLTSAPPTPPNPYDDWTREFDTPGPITMANERMGVFEGTPDPSTIAPPSRTPEVGNVNYSGPLPTQRLPQTQAAVSEPGMGLGPYGMTPPPMPVVDARTKDDAYSPPAYVPDFNFAPMPSPFGPQAGAMTGEGAPSSGVWSQPGSGQWMTDDRPKAAPAPALTMGAMQDQFDLTFAPGGPGMIMDLPAIANQRTKAATPGGAIDELFGPGQSMALPFAEVPRPPGIDSPLYSPTPMAETPVSPIPSPQLMQGASAFYRPDAFDPTFAGGTVTPATPTPGVTPGVVSGTMPTPEGAMDIRSPAQQAGQTTAPPPLPEPAPAPTQAARQPQRGAGGFIGRALGGLLGGPLGAMGGGLLGGGGGGGGFGFSQPATFAWSGGGSAPYGNKGGSTTYQKGTTNALGGTNALSWQGSKGQTVTVVQDPWTGTYMTAF